MSLESTSSKVAARAKTFEEPQEDSGWEFAKDLAMTVASTAAIAFVSGLAMAAGGAAFRVLIGSSETAATVAASVIPLNKVG